MNFNTERTPDVEQTLEAEPGIAPGRRTRSEGLPIQRRALGGAPAPAAPVTAPAARAAPAAPAEPADDPFGFHLAPVQRRVEGALAPAARDGAADVQAVADRGLAGGGGTLPHLEAVQRSFGRHDIGGVSAHVGGPAADAAAALGASAYATGGQVAFAAAPDLFTAAHEATHVVQQRGGVALRGGLDGGAADPYEQHADAVATAVVRGESAEALLDPYAAAGGADAGVQRRIDLVGLSSKPDAQLDDVMRFLRASDQAYGTTHAQTVAGDPELLGALRARIEAPDAHRYGFLQAGDLVTDLRLDLKRAIKQGSKVYDVDRTLREAADSVYQVSRDGETSVIKQAGAERQPEMSNEADMMERVRGHGNVIALIERAPDDRQIRMEYVRNGMLRDFQVDTEPKAKGLARGIIDGLAHCHAQGVVHGDLDNKNVFIGGTQAAPVAKIADFGSGSHGPEALRSKAAGDICGGATMLRSLATPYLPGAVTFVQAVAAVEQEAIGINTRNMQAGAQNVEAQALELGMSVEAYAEMMGPQPEVAAPTIEEVATLLANWRGLTGDAWLA